jgi:hypothetical protein
LQVSQRFFKANKDHENNAYVLLWALERPLTAE